MPAHELAKIDMTRIDFVNQLYGQEDLKRAQRRKARSIDTTMIVTLLGAAASDALESGQVVSGVGGQYNFVAMAHRYTRCTVDHDAAGNPRQQGRIKEQHSCRSAQGRDATTPCSMFHLRSGIVNP